jgi:hypothetical protein
MGRPDQIDMTKETPFRPWIAGVVVALVVLAAVVLRVALWQDRERRALVVRHEQLVQQCRLIAAMGGNLPGDRARSRAKPTPSRDTTDQMEQRVIAATQHTAATPSPEVQRCVRSLELLTSRGTMTPPAGVRP